MLKVGINKQLSKVSVRPKHGPGGKGRHMLVTNMSSLFGLLEEVLTSATLGVE